VRNPPVVGLDIGTFAVRAVELVVKGGRPTLSAFAQVTLPPGAVVDGEVVDVGAVGAAIRRLWAEGNFSTTKVVVGVSSQRVIVRQADMSDMTADELQSALSFEARELLPIPLEEALLDAYVLERGTGTEDAPTMRVLLAAAQRDVVDTHLAAVTAGGLSATAVDVLSLALLRAVPPMGPGSEAVIAVGGGLTTVVVRENGVPRFMRVLNVGGADVTDAIAQELGCDLDFAEDLKRRAAERVVEPRVLVPAEAGTPSAMSRRATELVAQQVSPVIEEIRGSLDFYLAQADVDQIDRVLVTGGGIRTPGFLSRLGEELGREIIVADPLQLVDIGKTGLTPEQIQRSVPLLVAPIGLALGGAAPSSADGINLLPAEVEAARRQRRQGIHAGVGVVLFATVLGTGWAFHGSQVSSAQTKATHAEAAVGQLQRQIDNLSDVTKAQTELQSRRQQLGAVLADDVDYVRLVEQIAATMPDDVWMQSFAAQKATGPTPGSVTMSVSGLSQDAVIRWVQQVGTIPALGNLWVPTTSSKGGDAASVVVSFQSTATITPDAQSDRAARLTGRQS
jgi:type IV pilus assembly protein PilM